MKRTACFIALTLLLRPGFSQVSVQRLLTENLVNPIGLDNPSPRFNWQLETADRNELQTAYEIRVSDRNNGGNGNARTADGKAMDGKERKGKAAGGKATVWNSGKILSGASIQVAYGGPRLLSGRKYFWQVRIWDNKGRVSAWSEPASWQMGLLKPADWKAQWIGPSPLDTGATSARSSPLFRTVFQSRANPVASATAYITAHGLYEARINGQRIGDACLTPGWTSYNKRLQYQVYDVTNLIRRGKNAIGVMLGSGWYRGYIGFESQKNFYGKDISLLFQLVIRYKNGRSDTLVSGPGWKSSTGAVRSAEIYNGETIDHRQEKEGWTLPDYDDAGWAGVRREDFPKDNLIATINEPIRKHETFPALKFITTPRKEQVIDFGQNLVGWVLVKIKGHAGDSIRLSHAEVLDREGNFYTDNLRAAKAQDVFILKGEGEEVFEPHFTFHGFRYIRIEGLSGPVDPKDFTAIALYSDMTKTGNFECSNPFVDQLQHNIQWGQRGNFLDVPTDCPQRDERLGWTGDAQVFSRTAAFNMGVENFFTKWLKDLTADQLPSGAVPFVIPNVLGKGTSAGWADVSTIIPWNLYLAYGDRRVLEEQYPSMKAWVEYIRGQAKDDLWNSGTHFGDWLFYRPFDDNDGRSAVTDKYLIAQCFYANSTQLLINAAAVLNKKDDSANYARLLQHIKDAFLHEYLTPNGRLVSGTQTAYTLALQFDMLPENLRKQAAERLVKNIQDYGYHLTTGFLGTPYLCHVLSRFGYTSVAYRLLLQDTYPSWLYPVMKGATTIWERWDGIRPDGSFQTPGMNSFNHYSYGAIGDWMYRVVAGLDTYEDGPGYRHSKIAPHPGGGLNSAAADLQTGYGPLRSHWRLEGSTLLLDLVVPANTHSTVYIPAPEGGRITESGQKLASIKEIGLTGVERGYLILDIGSGTYHFKVEE
jgi:alpha-L-rhamnosidase